jgi:acetyl-CoA synthetase
MYPVKPQLAATSRLKSIDDYRAMYRESIEQPEVFWRKQADLVTWFHPPQSIVKSDFRDIDFAFYEGGKLNACFNCVDRHVATQPDKTAIIFAADKPGEYRHISYKELGQNVNKIANVLRAHGVQRGDRVAIYLPMIPDLVYSMLACARIGAVHSIVFGGFSADSLRDRIVDAGCKVVITANEGLRGGRAIPLKTTVDVAIEGLPVEKVLVVRHTPGAVAMREGRDLWLGDEMALQRATSPVEWMDSEDPLFILYTSGSTGKPKGVLHTTAGYMVYAMLTHRYVFDWHPDDVYFCTADVGWITGHSYIVYGPLANGATSVLFESIPTYPDSGRFWQVVQDLKVSIFYTAPTALRSIARAGDEFVTRYDRSSLRVLGTVGEPINPEVWKWYHDVVGEGRCDIVDTWWQTETGGILITPLAGVIPTKPGSATLPFFGVEPLILDDDGNVLEGNDVRGNLCMRSPWPGLARTVYGDHKRFAETYFSRYPGLYFTGDGCMRDEDGYYWITGRVDDVLNVSGHRLGTAEVESALVAHPAVAEAAVVGFPHPIKGEGIYVYVHLKPDYEGKDPVELVKLLKQQVRDVIGPIATPDHIQIATGLPKTRSGKIMRRILRNIAAGKYDSLGDITTLADPSVVEALITEHKQHAGG